MKQRRSTPRRRTAPRWTAQDWEAANMSLYLRSGGRCEHCGKPLNGRVERHHRQRRRDGGDRLSNLLYLLPECHGWITEHPEVAKDHGWIVPTEIDPATVAVTMGIRGERWFLDDVGGREPAP